MQEIQLTKTLQIPSAEELDKETLENKHERYLRTLIVNKFDPIYIGDKVEVSNRWAGNGKNPYAGVKGEIMNIEVGLQAAFNIDYMVYTIKSNEETFQSWYYTLNMISQTQANKLLEKILRETNSEFENFYRV